LTSKEAVCSPHHDLQLSFSAGTAGAAEVAGARAVIGVVGFGNVEPGAAAWPLQPHDKAHVECMKTGMRWHSPDLAHATQGKEASSTHGELAASSFVVEPKSDVAGEVGPVTVGSSVLIIFPLIGSHSAHALHVV
jgi:hypothetical protein